MGVFLLFLYLIVSTTANENDFDTLWKEFKGTYSRAYKSLREEVYRADIFKSNLQHIKDHNEKYDAGNETYFLGINQFADLTDEEFVTFYLNYRSEENVKYNFTDLDLNLSVPASIDWRNKGAVLAIRNQGNCGSCWAFSAIAAVEGQIAIKHKRQIPLSEQELVDCSGRYKNHGCKGGLMDNAFKYIKDNGISTRGSYPYHARNGACHKKTKANVKVTGFRDIARTETALQKAVGTIGPISIAIHADQIKLYKGGVFNNNKCRGALNHGVVAVGYGSLKNQAYWIVRNSWGTSWGEHGYIRIARNKGNICGIASEGSYPTIA